jgi:hypothetical protein
MPMTFGFIALAVIVIALLTWATRSINKRLDEKKIAADKLLNEEYRPVLLDAVEEFTSTKGVIGPKYHAWITIQERLLHHKLERYFPSLLREIHHEVEKFIFGDYHLRITYQTGIYRLTWSEGWMVILMGEESDIASYGPYTYPTVHDMDEIKDCLDAYPEAIEALVVDPSGFLVKRYRREAIINPVTA